jgi:CRISPR-associated protein Csb2
MIAFAFSFPAGRYHATPWGRHANEADVAWPPEPIRILRALIATWWRKADHARFPKVMLDDLIDALAVEPPVFRLPDAVHTHTRAYMPAPSDRKLIYDAFLRLDRDAEMVIAWPDIPLTEEQQNLCAYLLERIGYLGRAESWACARLANDWDGEINSWPRAADRVLPGNNVPVDVAVSLTAMEWTELRANFLTKANQMTKAKRAALEATLPERLSDALAVDTSDWQNAGWSSPPPLRKFVYDRPPVGPIPQSRPKKATQAGQPEKPEVARFILAGRPLPRIEESLKIGEIARWALMAGEGVPPVEFSGRDEAGPLRADPSHAHAFFLPEDADEDGLIDHLLIFCRRGFSDEARRRLDRLTRLWQARGRVDADGERGRKEWRLALEDITAPESFASTSALVRRSRIWQSVSPYLKPRFDKDIARSFPELISTYHQQIFLEWARRFPNHPVPNISPVTDPNRLNSFALRVGSGKQSRSTLAFIRTRAGRGGRQPDTTGGFFSLQFEEEVEGPIALGWGAHFGLGLFKAQV